METETDIAAGLSQFNIPSLCRHNLSKSHCMNPNTYVCSEFIMVIFFTATLNQLPYPTVILEKKWHSFELSLLVV